MTTLKQIELESIFLVSIVAVASLFFVVHKNQAQFNMSVPIVETKPAEALEESLLSQISPDGAKKVILKIAKNNDNTQTYSFSTEDKSGSNSRFIFEKILDNSQSMIIPFNTFSSDNKYFFVQEDTGTGKSILAFKVSGEPFSETEKYFDVTDLFDKKNTGNNFGEATGWASESLIIINTTKPDKTKGPSYWFEVPSKAIIQLSTEF